MKIALSAILLLATTATLAKDLGLREFSLFDWRANSA
jgi:hypothetical protein